MQDALAHYARNAHNIGSCFVGDAYCSLAVWYNALTETREYRSSLLQTSFMHGGIGELMVGVRTKDVDFYGNSSSILGRKPQHDPMIMEWCYTPPNPKPPPWKKGGRQKVHPKNLDDEIIDQSWLPDPWARLGIGRRKPSGEDKQSFNTPYSAKKARKLCESPTDADMFSPIKPKTASSE